MKKKIRKLYRLTPLNNEIKKLEAKLFKRDYVDDVELSHITSVLLGLKTAHKLVKNEKTTT
mgnify:CR=1 FL=1